jgi:hypothetical protein
VSAKTGGALARAAAKVWAAAPVESVVLGRLDPAGAAALAGCPFLSRVRVLEVQAYSNIDGPVPLEALFGSPAVSGLWSLTLHRRCWLGPEGAEALAGCEPLRNLEVLALRYCGIGDEGGLALARSPHLGKLRDLDLTGNEFTGDVPSVLRKRFPGVQL